MYCDLAFNKDGSGYRNVSRTVFWFLPFGVLKKIYLYLSFEYVLYLFGTLLSWLCEINLQQPKIEKAFAKKNFLQVDCK